MTENLSKSNSKGCFLQKLFLLVFTIILLVALVGILGPMVGVAGILFIGYLIIRQFFEDIKDD